MKRISIYIGLLLTTCVVSWRCQLMSDFDEQPNILWITSEDMNSFIGAFGDQQANTPHLDGLATEGAIYTHAFATAPVCSPSRSCLITGVYASSLGSQHLRSQIRLPEEVIPFPKYLRAAGYYCTNSGKEDYNFTDPDIWDDGTKTSHWRNRKKEQPFFSVFNIETTHQSQIFGSDEEFHEKYGQLLTESERQNPDSIQVPVYHFDTPVVRKLWARYYDLVTLMDREVGRILSQLEEDGLTENTIVFFYSDHGTGMPRSKRSLYDSGLRIPLIIRAPEKWRNKLGLQSGSKNEEMISFVDFAPTILNLCGIDIPTHMQGIPFLGTNKEKQEFVFGHADRVDEAYEVSRTLRTHRFRYIRNFLPHLPLIQDNFYTDQSEIMQELRKEVEKGEMTAAQASMWESRRPVEELYDTRTDSFEVVNLAADFDLLPVLREFRKEMNRRIISNYDTGLLHEIDMIETPGDQSIYESARDTAYFPIRTINHLLESQLSESWSEIDIYDQLIHRHHTVRYWAAKMLEIKQWQLPETRRLLENAISDSSASVRIAAARALLNQESNQLAIQMLLRELESTNEVIKLTAARAIEQFITDENFPRSSIQDYYNRNCPQEDWNEYYKLYTCWSLQSALDL